MTGPRAGAPIVDNSKRGRAISRAQLLSSAAVCLDPDDDRSVEECEAPIEAEPEERQAAPREIPPALLARPNKGPRAPPLDDDMLLTAAQTRARVGGVTAMCVWRWMRDPRVRFPAPIKINNRNYWRFGDLRSWHAREIERTAA
jgi:hypothetical protein